MTTSNWEAVYSAGEQLNLYPYPEVVSFLRRRSMRRPIDTSSALDVGCGSGVHSFLLAKEGAEVVAFDGSPSAIKHARALHGDNRIDYSVATLEDFDGTGRTFDLVIDRLSSTYATLDVVANFYQVLKSSLVPGARIFWQGFDTENTGRKLGKFEKSLGIWTDFSDGIFAQNDTIYFFNEDELSSVFEGYEFGSKRQIKNINLITGYCHSYWSLELEIKTPT